MKTVLFFIFGLLLINASYAQPIIKITYSKPFAIINFLETAKGGHTVSQTFKHQIDTSFLRKDNNFQKLVTDYSLLRLDYNYTKDQYPNQRKHHTSTWDLLCIAAISSNTNEEFFNRLIGIYPNEDYLKLKDIITKTELFYNRFIYTKNQQVISDKLRELQGLSPKLNGLFEKFRLFYGSSWDKNIPFNLTIYPIEGNQGQTTATPHINSLEMGVLTKEEDVFGLLSIGMHEMCHVLFEEQPLELQQQLDSLFTEKSDPIKKMVYHYIDEALATSLGNGYAYHYLAGEIDSLEWYNDAYINAFAKAIYPLTERYINNKQQIDNAFLLKAIEIFAQTFPNAKYDFEPLLMNVDIYFDADEAEDRHDISNMINNVFRVYNSNTSIPIADPISINRIKESPETQLIIVNKNHIQNITKLKLLFKNIATLPNKKNILVSFLDKNNRAVIIVIAENKTKAEEGIRLLKTQKEINPKKWWTSF